MMQRGEGGNREVSKRGSWSRETCNESHVVMSPPETLACVPGQEILLRNLRMDAWEIRLKGGIKPVKSS